MHKEVAGSWFTSHVNENLAEVAAVAELFPGGPTTSTPTTRTGWSGPRSVLAHNVHPTDDELRVLAGRGAAVANCPTSNAALGSGLFSLRRHVAYGVRVALGSDVGAGTGFSLFKEGLQAYFHQPLLGPDGLPLTSAHLLYLATRPARSRWGWRSATSSVGRRVRRRCGTRPSGPAAARRRPAARRLCRGRARKVVRARRHLPRRDVVGVAGSLG